MRIDAMAAVIQSIFVDIDSVGIKTDVKNIGNGINNKNNTRNC